MSGCRHVPSHHSHHSPHPGHRDRAHRRRRAGAGARHFLDLLLGAAATKGGHVTDAILAAGLSRGWSAYYWFLESARWSWLRVCEAQLEVLKLLFHPRVWYAVIDDSVVERTSTKAPGSLRHHNHNAKPN